MKLNIWYKVTSLYLTGLNKLTISEFVITASNDNRSINWVILLRRIFIVEIRQGRSYFISRPKPQFKKSVNPFYDNIRQF